MEAEVERCSRYAADTEEHATQCWTAGCQALRDQCRPYLPPAPVRTPHRTEMAMCIQHSNKTDCHAEPRYRCRFDHDMVCVPNDVLHVPLHMQRRVVHAPPARTVRAAPVLYRKGDKALLEGGTVVVAEVRKGRRSGSIIYRVHNHSGAQLWVPEEMLQPLPVTLTDPYRI